MAEELEKTCENCKYDYESMEGEHCRHCIHNAEERFEPKVIVPTEAEIRAKAIDEFVEKIQWEYLNSCGLKQREIDFLVAVSSMVAEQMKGGAV